MLRRGNYPRRGDRNFLPAPPWWDPQPITTRNRERNRKFWSESTKSTERNQNIRDREEYQNMKHTGNKIYSQIEDYEERKLELEINKTDNLQNIQKQEEVPPQGQTAENSQFIKSTLTIYSIDQEKEEIPEEESKDNSQNLYNLQSTSAKIYNLHTESKQKPELEGRRNEDGIEYSTKRRKIDKNTSGKVEGKNYTESKRIPPQEKKKHLTKKTRKKMRNSMGERKPMSVEEKTRKKKITEEKKSVDDRKIEEYRKLVQERAIKVIRKMKNQMEFSKENVTKKLKIYN